MFKRLRAQGLNTQGNQLKELGHFEEAAKMYKQAAEIDSGWSSPRYNLGLIFKMQGNWAESLVWNQKALELDRKDQAAWWNLGIAATALKHWDIARQAWRGFGINIPDGEGPINFPCGFGPIRINPKGDAEVVWAHRIDPARAILDNIPFPETNHRWQDIVLNDGAPTGYRQYKGQEVPVFDALELLESSRFGTYVARVGLSPGPSSDSDRERIFKLAQVAADLKGSAEDWSTSVRMICKACSEGRAHETHDSAAAPGDGMHSIGIAAINRDHAESILSAWEKDTEGVTVEYLDDSLEPGST